MKSLILIPCYNTHEYLNDLISLLRSQSYNAILIIDDGSSPALNIEDFKGDKIQIINF